MPCAVQSLWIGDRLSKLEQLSIRSFLANGHEFHLYTYHPMQGIPPGTIHHDGNEILPASMIFRDQDIGSFSGFADLFRYKLLRERGGWWVDLDIVCMRPLTDPEEYAFALEAPGYLGNCVLFSRPASLAIEYLWNVARKKDPTRLFWCEIGPPLVQEAVDRFELQRCVMPAATFCPIPSSLWFDTFVPGRGTEIGDDSLGVHFWHEMWRRARLDKDEDYGPRSLYERLKAKYGLRNGTTHR